MLNKIKKLFTKKAGIEKEYISHVKFRPGIGAVAMEIYEGITIFYLEKPDKSIIYHLFHNRDFFHGSGATLEEVEALAHSDVDNNFKDYEARQTQNQ